MSKTASLLALLAATLACALPMPAQALASRTFLAAQGADSNPCTFAAPCRTFQHAHDQSMGPGRKRPCP